MVQPQCNSIMVALQQRRWPYKRSGGDLLIPVRSVLLWSCSGGSRQHLGRSIDNLDALQHRVRRKTFLNASGRERSAPEAAREVRQQRWQSIQAVEDGGSRRRRQRRGGWEHRRHNTMARWRRQRRGGWEQRRNNTMRRGVSRVSNLVYIYYIIYQAGLSRLAGPRPASPPSPTPPYLP